MTITHSLVALLSLSLVAAAPAAAGTVHVTSPDANITLNRVLGESSAHAYAYGGTAAFAEGKTWDIACVGTCDKDVGEGKYFVDGEDMMASNSFVLTGDEDIEVDPGKPWKHYAGIYVGAAGALATLTGAGAAAVGLDGPTGALIGIGIPMMLAGAVLYFQGNTSVKVTHKSRVALDLRRGALTF